MKCLAVSELLKIYQIHIFFSLPNTVGKQIDFYEIFSLSLFGKRVHTNQSLHTLLAELISDLF